MRDKEIDSSLFHQQVSERVRVRLLIAFPLLIVLILSIVSGILYQLVEAEFGYPSDTVGYLANEQQMGSFARKWIYLMIAVDVAGAIIGYFIADSITAPIHRLISVSKRVAGGDLLERANIKRPDDLGALSHSFDSMVESLNRFIEQRNRFILESFSGGLITLDIYGTITAMNTAAEKLLAVSAKESLGKSFDKVLAGRQFEMLRRTIHEALWEKQTFRLKKVPLETDNVPRMICVSTSPMTDEKGEPFGIIVNLRDLEEWERFHRELARTDQLATLGTFAAGLAHELRNPLGAIRGLAQLLSEDPTLPPHCKEYTRVIMNECQRLDGLVREIYDLSQPEPTPEASVNLNDLVREACLLARSNADTAASESVNIEEEFGQLPSTYAAPKKLLQVFINVIANAIEATPPDGKILIRTEYHENSEFPLVVAITNTGSNIPDELMEKIFEPFFTTKEGGSGLGLAIAHQIVRYHGGIIRAECRDDSVTFRILLPQREQPRKTSSQT